MHHTRNITYAAEPDALFVGLSVMHAASLREERTRYSGEHTYGQKSCGNGCGEANHQVVVLLAMHHCERGIRISGAK